MRTRQEISKHISIAYNMLDYVHICSINYLLLTTPGYNYNLLHMSLKAHGLQDLYMVHTAMVDCVQVQYSFMV